MRMRLAWLVPAVAMLAPRTCGDGDSVLRSTPLWSQNHLVLVVPMPANVRVLSSEPEANWASSAYNVRLEFRGPGSSRRSVGLEVLQYAWGRAERKGLLAGQHFVTHQGRTARLTGKVFKWGGKTWRNWYFAFLAQGSETVTILRFMYELVPGRSPDRVIRAMVRGARLEGATKGRTKPPASARK